MSSHIRRVVLWISAPVIVFAIVGGLGTPTHSKVVDYLNSEGVPDLLVSSGALQWDNPAKSPMTFGFQVDYTREGSIFNGQINWVQIDLGKDGHDHLISPEERFHVAMVRQ